MEFFWGGVAHAKVLLRGSTGCSGNKHHITIYKARIREGSLVAQGRNLCNHCTNTKKKSTARSSVISGIPRARDFTFGASCP